MKKLCLLFIALLGPSFTLPAAEAAEDRSAVDIARQIKACLEAEIKTLEVPEEVETEEAEVQHQKITRERGALVRGISHLDTIISYLQQGQDEQARRAISSLAIHLGNSNCREQITPLNDAIFREREAREAAYQVEFDALFEQLPDALLQAEKAEELDEYLEALSRLNQLTVKLQIQSRNQELSSYSSITSSWQEYLLYLEAEDYRQAAGRLNSVASYLTRTPIVPRSLVMKRQIELNAKAQSNSRQQSSSPPSEPPYTVKSVLESIESVDDLSEARGKLNKLKEYRSTMNDANRHLNFMDRLSQASVLIDNDSPYLALALLRRYNASGSDTAWVERVRNDITSRALIMVTPSAYRGLAEPEKVEIYVDTVAERMQEEQEWLALWEFLKVVRELLANNYQAIPGLDNDIRAIEQYLYAQKLEKAGDRLDAHSQYKSVMRMTGRYGPYDEATERVKYTNTHHAEEMRELEKQKAEVSSMHRRTSPGMRMPYDMRNQQQLEATVESIVAKQLAAWESKLAKQKASEQGPPKKESP